MRKDIWEAEQFDGIIFVRCSFGIKGQRGGCMRSIPIVMWESMRNQKAVLEDIISVMQADKENIIRSF